MSHFWSRVSLRKKSYSITLAQCGLGISYIFQGLDHHHDFSSSVNVAYVWRKEAEPHGYRWNVFWRMYGIPSLCFSPQNDTNILTCSFLHDGGWRGSYDLEKQSSRRTPHNGTEICSNNGIKHRYETTIVNRNYKNELLIT